MNYIKIVNHFWENAPYQDGYRSQHCALFFAVLSQINKNGWRKTKIDLGLMLCVSGLSKPTYIDARKWLVSNGWITVVEGKNAYQMAEFEIDEEVILSIKVSEVSPFIVNNPLDSDSLYLIYNKEAGTVKIGRSKDPKTRVKHLQTSLANKLELLFNISFLGYKESEAQEEFRELRLGYEWFRYDQKIIDYFLELKKAAGQ